MRLVDFEKFMRKNKLKNDTMKRSYLERIDNYPKDPGYSKIYSDEECLNIDIGERGATHWTCLLVKDNKS